MRKAVYAGSFDPITNGHLWMIREGARLFDDLVVAIGTNPDKHYTFALDERRRMIEESLADLRHVHVASFEGMLLVNYTASVGARYLLRGIRNEGDYEYERGMRHINSDLRPDIVTVFLMPPREIAEVSSSLVKSLIGPDGWEPVVRQYVPEAAFRLLLDRFRR